MGSPESPLVVRNSDYITPVEWSDEYYRFGDQNTWDDLLHCCLYRKPHEVLKKYKFVYKLNTEDHITIKTDAAVSALDHVIKLYERDYTNNPNYSIMTNSNMRITLLEEYSLKTQVITFLEEYSLKVEENVLLNFS